MPSNGISLASIDALVQAGRLGAARAASRRFLEENPINADMLVGVSRIEARCGDLAAACRHARQAAAMAPNNLEALFQLALTLRGLNRRDEECTIYERILSLNNGHVPSHLGLAGVAQGRRDEEAATMHFSAAHKYLTAAAHDQTNNRQVQLQLAAALRGLNRLDEAAAIYGAILRVDERHADAHSGLAFIARTRGDLATAIMHLEKVANINPADLRIQLMLGNVLVDAGRLEDAKAIYLRISAKSPEHFAICAALGDLAYALGSLSAAVEHFQDALKSDPDNIAIRIKLGRTLGNMARWSEAEEVFSGVLGDSPQNVEATKGLAYAAKARNDMSMALTLFETATKIAPFDADVKIEIRRLRTASDSVDWRAEIDDALSIARTMRAPIPDRIKAAAILVQHGLTEVVNPILCELRERSPEARKLLMAVRQMERMGFLDPPAVGAQSPVAADQQLESLQGFVEKLVPDSNTLLVVFGGMDHRIFVSFSLLHRILRKSGASVVYVRDLEQNWYTRGIVGLGHDVNSTVEGFQAIAARCGARRILTLGSCLGCIGALRYGLELGAEGVLGMRPRIRPDVVDSLTNNAGVSAIHGRTVGRPKDILNQYLAATTRPRVTLLFGELCERDNAEARAVANVTEVTTVMIPGSSEQNTILELLMLGLLEPVLLDFVATGAISPETCARFGSGSNQ